MGEFGNAVDYSL